MRKKYFFFDIDFFLISVISPLGLIFLKYPTDTLGLIFCHEIIPAALR